jgi:hypothetical protein
MVLDGPSGCAFGLRYCRVSRMKTSSRRPVLEERLAADRHQRLGGAGEVVGHVMVVPGRVDRYAAQELLDARVLAVVAMARAVLRHGFRHEVSAGHDARPVAWQVGVDRVAVEEEEVRGPPCHHGKDAVSAVDEPAEAGAAEITAPEKRDLRR